MKLFTYSLYAALLQSLIKIMATCTALSEFASHVKPPAKAMCHVTSDVACHPSHSYAAMLYPTHATL